MTTPLNGAWLALILVQALAWIGACVLGAGVGKLSARLRAISLVVLGTIGVIAAIGAACIAISLVQVNWAFGAEKLIIAAPIGVVSSLGALAYLVWIARHPAPADGPPDRRALGAGIGAALGAAAGLLVIFVVGPVVTAASVLSAIGLWAAASAAVLLGTAGRPRRAVIATGAFAGLCAGLLALFTVFGPSVAASAASHHVIESGATAAPAISVEDLREAGTGTGVRHYDLEARHDTIELPNGASFDAVDFGSVPGPQLIVTQGELVEVTLSNRDVEEGVTLHWHGFDVPNGDDGVAGVTQDVVAIGETFTYRFVAEDTGSYWYHTHQGALGGISRGLYGSFVVLPADGADDREDVTALIHTLGGLTIVGEEPVLELAGDTDVRLRLTNTDQVPRRLVLDGPAEVLAFDGRELGAPAGLPAGTVLRIPAGGRVDVGIAAGSASSLAIEGARGSGVAFGTAAVEALSFGGPEFDLLDAATGPMPSWADGPFDVHATQVLDRLLRVVDGVPRLADTINSAAFPFVDPIVVGEGDIVEVTIVNRGTETHPMHLHGHHALVLSRNGVVAEGALWLDSIDVRPGDLWRVAFVADNPGLWMDHCHNLEHARDGMIMHLAYEGVVTPFDLGGTHGNDPE